MPGSVSLPGPSDQIHSFHQPIAANGLYWTTPIAPGDLHISPDGLSAWVEVNNYAVIDQPTFPKPGPSYQAEVSLRATWQGVGPLLAHTDPKGKYRVQFRKANAQIEFVATVPSQNFTFTSAPIGTSESVFAMMGFDRNGVFF